MAIQASVNEIVVQVLVGARIIRRRVVSIEPVGPLLLQRNAEQRDPPRLASHDFEEVADVRALPHVVRQMEMRIVEQVLELDRGADCAAAGMEEPSKARGALEPRKSSSDHESESKELVAIPRNPSNRLASHDRSLRSCEKITSAETGQRPALFGRADSSTGSHGRGSVIPYFARFTAATQARYGSTYRPLHHPLFRPQFENREMEGAASLAVRISRRSYKTDNVPILNPHSLMQTLSQYPSRCVVVTIDVHFIKQVRSCCRPVCLGTACGTVPVYYGMHGCPLGSRMSIA